jgi:hypothetical protein
VRAVFTTRGAVLKSWQLKKYRDDSGRRYEIVAGHAPADAPLPFTLATDDAAVSALLAAARSPCARAARGGGGRRVRLRTRRRERAEGLSRSTAEAVRRSTSRARVTRDGQPLPATLRWGPALGSGITIKSRTYNPPPQPIFSRTARSRASRRTRSPRSPCRKGASGSPASTITTSSPRVVKPRAPCASSTRP